MNVLLSVKPKYVDRIRKGIKRYEFRKVIFSASTVEKIYIYSSSPVKKIVARFDVGEIIVDSPEKLWEITKEGSGISQEDFFTYFGDCEKGFAIEMKNIEFFDDPVDPFTDSTFKPPQSFCYMEEDWIQITNGKAEI